VKAEGTGGRAGNYLNGIAGIDERALNGVLTTDRREAKLIDQTQRITGIVRDELATQSAAHGVSKTEVGYLVSQTFAPMPGPDGQVGLFIGWIVTITLRLVLLGYEPAVSPVLIPGPLAPDSAYRESVKQALEKAIEMRDEVMRQVPAAGA
jgi:hypothetical protein